RATRAGTRSARCRSRTRRSSTARRVRPAAGPSPTGGCPGCSGEGGRPRKRVRSGQGRLSRTRPLPAGPAQAQASAPRRGEHPAPACRMARMTVHEVDASEVPENAFLLDVRELDEWRAGNAPQAVHIPMGDLRSRIGEVPDAQPIYVICRAGGRSAQAAAWLNHIGKQAINVGGGMQSWAAAGRPMVSETGMPPYVA